MSTCFYLRAGKKTKNNNTRGIQIYAAAELMFDTFFAEIKAQMSPSFPPFSFFFLAGKEGKAVDKLPPVCNLAEQAEEEWRGKREVEREKERRGEGGD